MPRSDVEGFVPFLALVRCLGDDDWVASELVFEVTAGDAAQASPIQLSEAGFFERAHLQEWVLKHPEIIGTDVMVVTSEFDRWRKSSGAQQLDRLDVLGLDSDGRLVVVEIKRGPAPDTTDLQAIKYAAMASRFEPDSIAEAHVRYLKQRGVEVSTTEALHRFELHTGSPLSSDILRAPRMVLIANSFPFSVTSTAVWLAEMGVDITLVQFQAYKLPSSVVIAASQLFPIPDLELFVVAPARAAQRERAAAAFESVEWTLEDYGRIRQLTQNPTILASLDLCGSRPGEWIALRDVESYAERTAAQARGDLAALTMLVKKQFARSNWPFEAQWEAGGKGQIYYRMTPDQARLWFSTSQGSSSDPVSFGTDDILDSPSEMAPPFAAGPEGAPKSD